jgi:nickel/cobalt transporter (NicO) family protein
MPFTSSATGKFRPSLSLSSVLLLMAFLSGAAIAHPLGNFTINHYSRLNVASEALKVLYIIEMAEIAAFQELQSVRAGRGEELWSKAILDQYAKDAAARYSKAISITVDGAPVSLRLISQHASTRPGDAGMPILRVECQFEATVSSEDLSKAQRLRFKDQNFQDRIGWREIVVAPAAGVAVFDTSSYSNGVTNELFEYPTDLLIAPIDERTAEFSFKIGDVPAGARPLMSRDGKTAIPPRDRFASLITAPTLSPSLMFFGLLAAFMFGGLHALSPGHGKTVVGAYLVGARGTPQHAAFLGLTVTITHTLGVFALGVVTLLASQYIVPDRLFSVISFVSGALVFCVGMNLFLQRISQAASDGRHLHDHEHLHPQEQGQDHRHSDHSHTHSHDGHSHSHLPPGAGHTVVTWKSLLALGISGGALPCPSALVLLLSAISMHRVGYGLVLIVAFSVGLASVLTCIGLAFIYARRHIHIPVNSRRLVEVLPILSAIVIAVVGAVICYNALKQMGLDWLS